MGVGYKNYSDVIKVSIYFLVFLIVFLIGIFRIEILNFIYTSFSLPQNSGGWFYAYQTLIAGILAISGAFLTIKAMNRTHNELIYRSNLKARAYMHDAAREICEYCQKLFNHVYKELDKETNIIPLNLEHYKKPDIAIDHLKENIGYLDKESARAVSILFSKYQVFHSRASRSNANLKEKLASQLLDLAEINIYSLRLFEYARAVEKENFDNIIIKSDPIVFSDIKKCFWVWESNYYGDGKSYSPSVFLNSTDFDKRIKSRCCQSIE